MEDIYTFIPKPFIKITDISDNSNSDDDDNNNNNNFDLFSKNKKKIRKVSKYKTQKIIKDNNNDSNHNNNSNNNKESENNSSSSFSLKKTLKSINLDSDDEEDDNQLKKTKLIVNLDSESDDNNDNSNNTTNRKKRIFCDDDSLSIESHAKKAVEELFEKTISSVQPISKNNLVINLVANSDQEVKKYSEFLSRHRQKKTKTLIEDTKIDNSSEPIEIIPSIILPIVRKASERLNSNNSLDSFNLLTTPTSSLTTQLSTSSITSQQSLPSIGNLIKLNTRLNGKHSGNWKMSKTDSFIKLKDALRAKYGFNLTNTQIKLSSCEGPLNDNDTPEDVDLEDEDLIDVTIKVSESEMADAIKYFESSLQSRTNSSSSTSLTPSNSISSSLLPSSSLPSSSNTTTTNTSTISNPTMALSSSSSTTTTTTTNSNLNENIIQIRILIPDSISTSSEEFDILVRVNKNQTLNEIHENLLVYYNTEDVRYLVYDSINDTILPTTTELDNSILIQNVISQYPNQKDLTLLIQPKILTSLELNVTCYINKNNNESRGSSKQRSTRRNNKTKNNDENNNNEIEQPQIITLIVKPSQTCRKMIEKITSHFNLLPSNCIFTFNNRIIKQIDTYEDLGVVNGSQLVMRLK